LGDAKKQGRLTMQEIYISRFPRAQIDENIANHLAALAPQR
jgi:hypothetical protein